MIVKISLLIFVLLYGLQVYAETNLGAINSIQNGFLESSECGPNEASINNCPSPAVSDLFNILNLATQNQCIASEVEYQSQGVSLPECPDESDQIKGMDNTHPTGGMFAYYYGNNASFIHNLVTNFLNDNEVGRFNVIIPENSMSDLREQPELAAALNHPRVNVIPLKHAPRVRQWMRDSFQVTTKNGRPVIMQIEHPRENRTHVEARLACQVAQQCNLPHYIPSDFQRINSNLTNLDMGGNLEVLPGGSFIRGTIGESGHRHNLSRKDSPPWQSPFQERQQQSLEAEGNRVLNVDVSFSRVGHVDELFNVIRTNRAAPCDYAIMMASPQKGIELLENYVATHPENPIGSDYCYNNRFKILKDRYKSEVVTDQISQEIYQNHCFDDQTIHSLVQSDEFQVLKRMNIDGDTENNVQGISTVMENNRRLVEAELRATTQCEDISFIEVPVLFRDGKSIAPNQVNSFIDTQSSNQPSSVLAPRTYVSAFDEYIAQELEQYGANASMIHDMGYHLQSGEVHCGTNEARLCRPR
jgi:hypothetical protein